MLCKPLEHAFDDARIIFTYDDLTTTFTLVLLDETWRGIKLFDKAQELASKGQKQASTWRGDLQTAFGDLTYGSCHGRRLMFMNDNRPFKRCLSFHAQQAVRRARREKYLPEGWDDKGYNIDYLSEAAQTAIRTSQWVHATVDCDQLANSQALSLASGCTSDVGVDAGGLVG